MKRVLPVFFLFWCFLSNAQTFTFACMDSTQLTGINCDVCPVTNITSRSFCGLLIYKSGVPYKWIDQPYTARQRPGNSVEYLEQIPSIQGVQTQDKVTIAMSQTVFSTVQGMIDSTVCHCASGVRDTLPLWYASDSIDHAPVFRGDTVTIVGRDLAHVTFDSALQKYIVQVDSVSGGATDLTFTGSGPTYNLNSSTGTGVTITQGSGITLTRLLNDLEISAVDNSTTNEIQTYGHASAANLYTNTLSLGGTFSIAGAGINVVTSTAGAVVVTGTEVDGSITNEGLLGVGAGGAASSVLLSNTSTAAGVTINAAGILAISETASANGGQITLTATEVGLGTVTNVSSGNFAPLFTVAVANPTTTPAFSFTATNGTAKSVFGVTGNAAAARADIATTTADQVLRNNGANNAIGWGTVATGGITDDAVTYAKMQNATANNILLGTDGGIGSDIEELNAAAVQTMLGYVDGLTLAAQRIAFGSDANTIEGEAAFLYDKTNDRQTIVCTTPALGIGAAILNLQNAGTDNSGEALRADGNITGNWLMGISNSNTSAATNNTIVYASQAGNSAGDPIFQLNITGAGGVSTAIGLDNSNANQFKITPNGASPGVNANASFVATQASPPLWGINTDAPEHALDVPTGRVRSMEFIGLSSDEPTVGTLGNGLGTGAAINDVTGTNNGFSITFTAGSTGLVAGGNMFVVTYSDGYPGFAIPVFCQGNDAAAGELNKFSFAANSGASFTMKVAAGQTLTASAQYILYFAVNGF